MMLSMMFETYLGMVLSMMLETYLNAAIQRDANSS
jgi:hypothetical protein